MIVQSLSAFSVCNWSIYIYIYDICMSQEAGRKLRFVTPLCGRLVTLSLSVSVSLSTYTHHIHSLLPALDQTRPRHTTLYKKQKPHNWHLIDWQLLVSFWQLGGKVKLLSISLRIRIQRSNSKKKEYNIFSYFYWQRQMPPRIALNKIDWEIVNKKRKMIFLHNFLLFLYGDFSIWCGESDEQIEHTTNCETWAY